MVGRAISVSMAFVAITSPFLGGIADYSGRRKRLLSFIRFYVFICLVFFPAAQGNAPGRFFSYGAR